MDLPSPSDEEKHPDCSKEPEKPSNPLQNHLLATKVITENKRLPLLRVHYCSYSTKSLRGGRQVQSQPEITSKPLEQNGRIPKLQLTLYQQC